jgi:flagellar FliJ protein
MMNGRIVFRSSSIIPHSSFPHMASFVFKLHALLRQRELVEQQCQREFAAAQAEKVREETELKRLDEVVRVAVADLRQNQLIGELDLSFLSAHRRFMFDMQRKGLIQLEKVDAATKKAAAVRLKLAEALKQKKIIEKLRERQLAAWNEALARKETAAMDEIAMQMSAMTMTEQWDGIEPVPDLNTVRSEHGS